VLNAYPNAKGIRAAEGIINQHLAKNGVAPTGVSTNGQSQGGNSAVTQDTVDARTKGTILEGRVTIDAKLNGKTGNLGHTDHRGRVRLDPLAFESAGVLDSVLAHEGAHVKQIAEKRFHAFENTPEALVNEVEAYRAAYNATVDRSPNDAALDRHLTGQLGELGDAIEGLRGTPYFKNVTTQPRSYGIDPKMTCPTSVCRF